MKKDLASRFWVGLDLGRVSEPTALAILERTPAGTPAGRGDGPWRYDVRHLERFPLGTPYPAIVAAVAALVRRPELRPWVESRSNRLELAQPPNLIVDATAVGSAIADLFLTGPIDAEATPLVITAGGQPREEMWGRSGTRGSWVPKSELVGTIQMLLQTGRLKVVSSLALAAWLGENAPAPPGAPIAGGVRHVITAHVPGWTTRGWGWGGF